MEEDILKEIEETNESKTSNEIVEIDENDEISNTQYDLEKVEEPLGKKKKEKKPSKWSKLSKKAKIIIIVSAVVLLIVVVLLLWLFVFKKDNKQNEYKEPSVVLEKENYKYVDGKLIFLDQNKKELGSYECKNKNENLCYIAYYSNEDDFDEFKKVYESGLEVSVASDIYKDKYVFVYDDEKKENGEVTLYNIKDNKNEGVYSLVKEVNKDKAIVKKNDKYGIISFDEDLDVSLDYEYMGYILDSKDLIVATNNNYKLISFDGKDVSKTVPGKIMSYDSDNISVKNNTSYHVYDYTGNMVIDKEFDYIRFADSYIIGANGKKLFAYDSKGNIMNMDGIKITSSDYNTKLIFNDELRQTGKEEAFSASVSGKTLKIEYGDEYAKINLSEGEVSSNMEYISYFQGKLYFYKDAEKKEILGSYQCSYANNLSDSNQMLENCYLGKQSNIVNNNEYTSYLPIYNNRYVFIADTKSPNANDNIVLYDLKNNKKLATYKSVDAAFESNDTTVNFVNTAGTLVVTKNTSDSFGLINVVSNSVDGVIPFKDKDTNATNESIKIVNGYYITKRSDKTNHIYDTKGNEITKNMSIKSDIESFESEHILVKNENGKYMVFDMNGKVVSSEYDYILIDKEYYVSVDSENILGLYKYDSEENKIGEKITLDSNYKDSLNFGIRSNRVVITYKQNNETKVIEVNI